MHFDDVTDYQTFSRLEGLFRSTVDPDATGIPMQLRFMPAQDGEGIGDEIVEQN